MSNPLIVLATGITSALNNGTFSSSFEAERHYRPTFSLEDLDSVHVIVVPKANDSELLSRSSVMVTYQVQIGIMKRGITDIAAVDAMMALVTEINTYVQFLNISGYVWTGTGNDPVFDEDHLENNNQFTSVLTVNYRKTG